MPGFVHLHVHSSYTLLEGALTIARLAELAKADRQPALALTDTDNMFGALEFSDKMAAAASASRIRGTWPMEAARKARRARDETAGPIGADCSVDSRRPGIVRTGRPTRA